MAEHTEANLENLSFDVLLHKNFDQLQSQGDLLVLFIHWLMMDMKYFLNEKGYVRIQVSQANQLLFLKIDSFSIWSTSTVERSRFLFIVLKRST